MSFILDALRKSETERQKQSAPGLADTSYKATQGRRNIWLPILVVILAANAVVVTILLLGNEPEAIPAVTSVRQETAVIQREPASEESSSAVRPLYRETLPPKPVAPAEQSAPQIPPAPMPKTAPETPAPAPAQAPASDDTLLLPSLQQLTAAGMIALPELHLDIHVFAGEAAKRFVYINSSKYREGDSLKEGPKIERITETGAVLSHQGNRFTLERE